MENVVTSTALNTQNFSGGTTMRSGETFSVGRHEEASEIVVTDASEQKKSAPEKKERPVDKIAEAATNGKFSPREVLEKNADGEFDKDENQESFDETQDKSGIMNYGKVNSEQISLPSVQNHEQIPNEVKQDPRFRELYAEHALNAAENGEEVTHEQVLQSAYKEFMAETEGVDGEIKGIENLNHESFDETQDKSGIMNHGEENFFVQELERVKAENASLKQELAGAHAEISTLKQRMQMVEMVLQLMKKQLEEEAKKKKEKHASVIQILIRLITMLLAEILVDDEEERKKISEAGIGFGSEEEEEDHEVQTLPKNVIQFPKVNAGEESPQAA